MCQPDKYEHQHAEEVIRTMVSDRDRARATMANYSGKTDVPRLSSIYIEQMRAHVDEGGKLSHRNGLDLLAEVERLQESAVAPAERAES